MLGHNDINVGPIAARFPRAFAWLRNAYGMCIWQQLGYWCFSTEDLHEFDYELDLPSRNEGFVVGIPEPKNVMSSWCWLLLLDGGYIHNLRVCIIQGTGDYQPHLSSQNSRHVDFAEYTGCAGSSLMHVCYQCIRCKPCQSIILHMQCFFYPPPNSSTKSHVTTPLGY